MGTRLPEPTHQSRILSITPLLTALFLGLFRSDRVDSDASQEILSRVRVANEFNTEVDPLLDVPVSDDLFDEDADCTGGHVLYDSRSSIIRINSE